MKRLSIIIPIYNLEDYIGETLESCLRQDISKDDYEIICVNDGSKDNSVAVIEKYQEKYGNIRLHTQENKGVSSARNKGIEMAEGKYVWFVDGDDIIADNSLAWILKNLEEKNIDVLGFCMRSVTAREPLEPVFEECVLCEKGANTVSFMTRNGGVGGGVCCQIFKTELLKQNSLSFVQNIKYSEDVLFGFQVLIHAKVCAKTDSVLYYYYQREGSAMHSNNHDKHIESMYLLAYEYQKIADKHFEWAEIALNKKYFAIKALLFGVFQKGNIKYAKKVLQKLKAEKLYPYPFLKATLKNNATKKQAVINYVSYFFPWEWYFMLCVRCMALKNKLKGKQK